MKRLVYCKSCGKIMGEVIAEWFKIKVGGSHPNYIRTKQMCCDKCDYCVVVREPNDGM